MVQPFFSGNALKPLTELLVFSALPSWNRGIACVRIRCSTLPVAKVGVIMPHPSGMAATKATPSSRHDGFYSAIVLDDISYGPADDPSAEDLSTETVPERAD